MTRRAGSKVGGPQRPWPAGPAGSAAVELVAGIGLLVLPAVLLVLSIPSWAQARTAAETAAREAARTIVLADDPTSASALEAGREAAATVLANHGYAETAPTAFSWRHHEVTGVDGPVSQRHAVATVRIRMPGVSVPFIGSWAPFDWVATHAEPIDVYRSLP